MKRRENQCLWVERAVFDEGFALRYRVEQIGSDENIAVDEADVAAMEKSPRSLEHVFHEGKSEFVHSKHSNGCESALVMGVIRESQSVASTLHSLRVRVDERSEGEMALEEREHGERVVRRETQLALPEGFNGGHENELKSVVREGFNSFLNGRCVGWKG